MANTVSKSHSEIPFSADDWPRWQAFEQWHDRREVRWPSANTAIPVQDHCDVYYRFPFTRITGNSQGSWVWTWFDARVNEAIAKKQKFHFGFMSCWPDSPAGVLASGGITLSNGATACVPQWLWNQMDAHATLKPWVVGNYIVPNYNNPDYLAFLLAAYQATQAHITAMGWDKVIGCIDIRGVGSWGEWHHHPYAPNGDVLQFPAGRRPTVASLKTMIDHMATGFPNKQLVIMFSTFDAEWLRNTYTQPEVTEYALNKTNSLGKFGWRRDNVGATDQYMKDYAEFNHRGFGSIPAGSGPTQGFKVPILARPDIAPVTGEPPGWNPQDYFDIERQVRLHRMSSFGNGNLGVTPNTTISDRIRAAAKYTGSRIKITTSVVTYNSGNLQVQINWHNVGQAPLYKYDIPQIIIEVLNSAGTVIQTRTSTFNLQLFLPAASPTLHTDNFAMTLPIGTYSARVYVKDANGYRDNYRLAIQGADSGWRYSLGSFDSSTAVPPNPGPVVNAGGDKQIKLPVNNVTLSGTVTDDDPVNQIWTQVSRPSGATADAVIASPAGLNTNVTGLNWPGIWVFRLTATDSESASNFDNVNVEVLPADVIPPDPPEQPVLIVKEVQLWAKTVFTNGTAQNAPVKVSGIITATTQLPTGTVPVSGGSGVPQT